MFNFKRTGRIFILLMVLTAGIHIWTPVHWGVYAFWVLALAGCMAYGSAYICSQFYIPAICHVPNNKRQVALTFDDGPDPEITPQVLAILKEYEVKATFFCIGRKVEAYPALVRQIIEAGHIVGNHSYTHSYWIDFKTPKLLREEISRCRVAFEAAAGVTPLLFRPPYGVTTPAMAEAVKAEKNTVIGWDVRSLDGLLKDEQQIIQRVQAKIKPGSIILLHDTNPAQPRILRTVLQYLRDQRLQAVRLDELTGLEAY
ncbi:MAG: polysaccharide deacetylase family protein [Saprospiraceae bacterium]|nr:polysaccharide deacetylase family protein [Saprospiraceae bacterium]